MSHGLNIVCRDIKVIRGMRELQAPLEQRQDSLIVFDIILSE